MKKLLALLLVLCLTACANLSGIEQGGIDSVAQTDIAKVVSKNEVMIRGNDYVGSGLGAVIGGGLGAVLAEKVGHGTGREISRILLGSTGGAIGAAIGSNQSNVRGVQYILSQNGKTISVVQPFDSGIQPGDTVRMVWHGSRQVRLYRL